MADRTGFKQAVVVYRVNADGEPLGVDGLPISETGHKQAIALLTGYANPNPALYEVDFYFGPEDSVDGTPTVEYSDDCPAGFISVTPSLIVLETAVPTAVAHLISSENWTATTIPNLVTLSITSGSRGEFDIVLTRTANIGNAQLIFTNDITGQTAKIDLYNVTAREWILEHGTWNMIGFWFDDGIWNYS